MTTKPELIARIADDSGQTKLATTAVLEALENAILDDIGSGTETKVLGLGKFTIKPTAARKGRNPATGAVLDIPAGKRLAFKPTKTLKDAL